MAGSGSRDTGIRPPKSPCSSLRFRTVLNSPQANIIKTLQVGDELPLSVLPSPPSPVVATHNGVAAGTVTGSQVNALINCIMSGFQFVAAVIEVRGGQCIVDVHIK